MRKIRTLFCLLGFILFATGCSNHPSSQEPAINYADNRLILAGKAPWGKVELTKASDGGVEGKLPWGNTKIQQQGSYIFGTSPWGKVELTYVNGQIQGKMPWGHADLAISDTAVHGKIPWGKVDIQLSGQNLDGKLPWGSAHLRLGNKYNSLTNPDVLLAVAALLSDKT